MNLHHPEANLYIPDNTTLPEAIQRTTHLAVGAHQDDLEFWALHGIQECFRRDDRWFGGITCTDGSGSARTGFYANHTDEEMKRVRVREQKTAAVVGEYGFIAQLGYPSKVAKDVTSRAAMVNDIQAIIKLACPEVIYTHNPFDRHATHVGVFHAVLDALRNLPQEERPRKLLGYEAWRGLDWLPTKYKTILSLDARPSLASAFNGVFDSQIAGGKRYDLAVEGRRRANATMHDSHSADNLDHVTYAIDMTIFLDEPSPSLSDFMQEILDEFHANIYDLHTQVGHR